MAKTLTSDHILYAATRRGTALGLVPNSPKLSIKYAALDLKDKGSMSALTERIQREDGGCDVLINNAGVYHYEPNLSGPLRRETVDINYRGTLAVSGTSLEHDRSTESVLRVTTNQISHGCRFVKLLSPFLERKAGLSTLHRNLGICNSLAEDFKNASAMRKTP